MIFWWFLINFTTRALQTYLPLGAHISSKNKILHKKKFVFKMPIKATIMSSTLPVLNLLVFLLVFWCSFCFGRSFTCKLKTFFDRAEEVVGHVVAVVQGGDDVRRAGDGFELKWNRVKVPQASDLNGYISTWQQII